jgi:hypothetical protein
VVDAALDEGVSKLSVKDEPRSTAGGTSAKLSWTWVENHELPRWGQNSADLASVGLPGKLRYPTLVTPKLSCKKCGGRADVRLLRHHPGGCGAFEWTYGIDIDWRWTCCGKHESFQNVRGKRKCEPNGQHDTGCVEAPLCTACFTCPCVALIARCKQQEDDF